MSIVACGILAVVIMVLCGFFLLAFVPPRYAEKMKEEKIPSWVVIRIYDEKLRQYVEDMPEELQFEIDPDLSTWRAQQNVFMMGRAIPFELTDGRRVALAVFDSRKSLPGLSAGAGNASACEQLAEKLVKEAGRTGQAQPKGVLTAYDLPFKKTDQIRPGYVVAIKVNDEFVGDVSGLEITGDRWRFGNFAPRRVGGAAAFPYRQGEVLIAVLYDDRPVPGNNYTQAGQHQREYLKFVANAMLLAVEIGEIVVDVYQRGLSLPKEMLPR